MLAELRDDNRQMVTQPARGARALRRGRRRGDGEPDRDLDRRGRAPGLVPVRGDPRGLLSGCAAGGTGEADADDSGRQPQGRVRQDDGGDHAGRGAGGRGPAVALADADAQKSALHWLKARPAGAAPVAGLDWTHKGDIGDAPKGLDWLVIDAPGALKGARAEALIAESDALVAPVLPSAFDTDSTRRFLREIEELKRVRKGGSGVHLVANRMRTGRAGERQRGFFDGARRRRRSPGSPSAAPMPTWRRRGSACSTGGRRAICAAGAMGADPRGGRVGERAMDLGIRGRRAIVCAGSKGLGRGCAEALAAEGVELVLNARGAEALEATAAAIRDAARRRGDRGRRRHHHGRGPRRGARRLPRARHPGHQRRRAAAGAVVGLGPRGLPARRSTPTC